MSHVTKQIHDKYGVSNQRSLKSPSLSTVTCRWWNQLWTLILPFNNGEMTLINSSSPLLMVVSGRARSDLHKLSGHFESSLKQWSTHFPHPRIFQQHLANKESCTSQTFLLPNQLRAKNNISVLSERIYCQNPRLDLVTIFRSSRPVLVFTVIIVRTRMCNITIIRTIRYIVAVINKYNYIEQGVCHITRLIIMYIYIEVQ